MYIYHTHIYIQTCIIKHERKNSGWKLKFFKKDTQIVGLSVYSHKGLLSPKTSEMFLFVNVFLEIINIKLDY